MSFLIKRRDGEPVEDEWLKETMDMLLCQDQPRHWETFMCSNGWVDNFKNRYGITMRCQTNKKTLPIHQKLDLIRKFHTWLHGSVQCRLPQRCSSFGRFPPKFMFHMDQVRVYFVYCMCVFLLNLISILPFLLRTTLSFVNVFILIADPTSIYSAIETPSQC